MFSISFSAEPLEYPFDDPSIPAAPGKLVLGKCEEEFIANLSIWNKSDYEAHWTRELKALVKGSSKVALVVSYDDPKAASNLEIWRAYHDEQWVHFQNQLLAYRSLPNDFRVSEISRYIQDRVVTNAQGDQISEWNVALRDIELFLRCLGDR
jgi:hypothetical protein